MGPGAVLRRLLSALALPAFLLLGTLVLPSTLVLFFQILNIGNSGSSGADVSFGGGDSSRGQSQSRYLLLRWLDFDI